MKHPQKRDESPMRSAIDCVPALLRYVGDPILDDETRRENPATTESCYCWKLGLEVRLASTRSIDEGLQAETLDRFTSLACPTQRTVRG
jgi:hypothetical protein